MTCYVFLGPSLALADAKSVLDAVFLPPAAMGDLYRLVEYQGTVGDIVVVIDGFFEQKAAIWHKEILYALSKGFHVIGASSMGALRAAELHPFGMLGVGRVFESYREGEIEGDDEVAVSHAPKENGYRPLSEAMVSIRHTLNAAHKEGIIGQAMHTQITAIAKSLFYAERSWPTLYDRALKAGVDTRDLDRLKSFVNANRLDLKRSDALQTLAYVVNNGADFAQAHKPSFVFEETAFWVGLTRTEREKQSSAEAASNEQSKAAAILNYLRIRDRDWDGLWARASLRWLAQNSMLEAVPTSRRQRALRQICLEHQLDSTAKLHEWLQQQSLSKQDLSRILDLEVKLHDLSQRERDAIGQFVVQELRRSGRYAELVKTVLTSEQKLARLGIDKPSMEDIDIDIDGLQQWYEQTTQRKVLDARDHAAQLGFQSFREFTNALICHYLIEQE